jgi:uncharacterized protein
MPASIAAACGTAARRRTGTLAHTTLDAARSDERERTRPVRNAFRYPVYYLGLDLDELDSLDGEMRLFAHNARGLVSLWDRDHGPHDGTALRPWIEALVARVGIDLAGGRVTLLTIPRVLGARFYPVSFWYCFGADGSPLAVLAEVHNTYRDRHNYLLHNAGAPFDWGSRPTAAKAFYVSPFVQREDVTYEFAFSDPGENLSVTVSDLVSGPLMLTTTLALSARDLTDASLVRTVLGHGPMSVAALVLIHWQALKLVLKRVPFYPHTPPSPEETSL